LSDKNYCAHALVLFHFLDPNSNSLALEYEKFCKSLIPENHKIKESFVVSATNPELHNSTFYPNNLLDGICNRTLFFLSGEGELTIGQQKYIISEGGTINLTKEQTALLHTINIKKSVKSIVIVHDETDISPWKLIIKNNKGAK
jgi:hypothetical protein